MGCDVNNYHFNQRNESFNPRTRMGCDMSEAEAPEYCKKVSIHAPAWGATKLTNFQ